MSAQPAPTGAAPIGNVWRSLAGQRIQMVESFYRKLFERFPQYREMFPAEMDPQMERMVEMFTTVASFSTHIDLVRPYLLRVGEAHAKMDLTSEDLGNFRDVFLETLSDIRPAGWNEAHAAAWRTAFDDVIIPIIEEGMGR